MQFNFRIGGDPSYVEKRGYWNDDLALRWIQEAISFSGSDNL
jgi:hypothetical protein